MLQNWTDGQQTFGKWLEYFQMTEMCWHFFFLKIKIKWIDEIWIPSYPHQSFMFIALLLEVMYFRFTFVSQPGTYFSSKWGPGRQKSNSISEPAVSLHSKPKTTCRLPALWSFSPQVCPGCCCHMRVSHSWVCWDQYFLRHGQCWCDVCFILGRWHEELSVLKTYTNASLDWWGSSFVPSFTRISRLIPTLPCSSISLISHELPLQTEAGLLMFSL